MHTHSTGSSSGARDTEHARARPQGSVVKMEEEEASLFSGAARGGQARTDRHAFWKVNNDQSNNLSDSQIFNFRDRQAHILESRCPCVLPLVHLTCCTFPCDFFFCFLCVRRRDRQAWGGTGGGGGGMGGGGGRGGGGVGGGEGQGLRDSVGGHDDRESGYEIHTQSGYEIRILRYSTIPQLTTL